MRWPAAPTSAPAWRETSTCSASLLFGSASCLLRPANTGRPADPAVRRYPPHGGLITTPPRRWQADGGPGRRGPRGRRPDLAVCRPMLALLPLPPAKPQPARPSPSPPGQAPAQSGQKPHSGSCRADGIPWMWQRLGSIQYVCGIHGKRPRSGAGAGVTVWRVLPERTALSGSESLRAASGVPAGTCWTRRSRVRRSAIPVTSTSTPREACGPLAPSIGARGPRTSSSNPSRPPGGAGLARRRGRCPRPGRRHRKPRSRSGW